MSKLDNIADKRKIVTASVVILAVAVGAYAYFSSGSSGPEFVVNGITIQKGEIELGEPTKGLIKIRNEGREKGKYTIKLGENKRSVIIPAGGEGEISFSLNSDQPGMHEIKLDNITKRYLVYRPFPFLGAKVKYTASGQLGTHYLGGTLTYEVVDITDNSFSAKRILTGTLRTFIENKTKIYEMGEPFDWGIAMDNGELIDEIEVKKGVRDMRILHYRTQTKDENTVENIGLYVPQKMNVPVAFYRETSSGSVRYAITETNIGYLKIQKGGKSKHPIR